MRMMTGQKEKKTMQERERGREGAAEKKKKRGRRRGNEGGKRKTQTKAEQQLGWNRTMNKGRQEEGGEGMQEHEIENEKTRLYYLVISLPQNLFDDFLTESKKRKITWTSFPLFSSLLP
jgi:hypothetical protein